MVRATTRQIRAPRTWAVTSKTVVMMQRACRHESKVQPNSESELRAQIHQKDGTGKHPLCEFGSGVTQNIAVSTSQLLVLRSYAALHGKVS